MQNKLIKNITTQFLLYKTNNNQIKVDVLIQDETVWLTIEQMAELFSKNRSTINEHILNIYKEGELEKEYSLRKIGNSDFLYADKLANNSVSSKMELTLKGIRWGK